MRNQSKSRFVNGVISAFIVCFFLVHGLLGSLVGVLPIKTAGAWAAWIGVAVVVAHVVVSIVTSYQQMTDEQFPPSARKKRHLVLKWCTGILLATIVCAHIVYTRATGAAADVSPALPAVVIVILSAVLAWHICVGAKSLLKDIGLDKGLMTPLRVVVCILAVAFAVMAIATIVL